MRLGEAFPAGHARASAERQLLPGAVIKLRAKLDGSTEKEKRFVVVHVSDEALCCVMNTLLHSIIKNNPDLLKCQVAVARDDVIADHDCHLDCSRVRTFKKTDILDQLTDEPGWILGKVSPDLRDQIVAGVKASIFIPPPVATDCVASLENADLQ